MIQILGGDCREVLKGLPDESVHCVVTSPPYWGLRDYGTAVWEGGDAGCDHSMAIHSSDPVPPACRQCRKCGRLCRTSWQSWNAVKSVCDKCGIETIHTDVDTVGTWVGIKDSSSTENWTTRGTRQTNLCKCGARRIDSQLGLESSPAAYVEQMVAVFREVRRVLRDDATLWLNLGDSYSSGGRGGGANGSKQQTNVGALLGPKRTPDGLKDKDLVGIPWRVAFALQADGWYLRQDIIWSKPNPMPESVTDRCTKAHEYIFLLSKSARYYYDADAIREEPTGRTDPIRHFGNGPHASSHTPNYQLDGLTGRNKRSVWEVATAPFSEAHFATFPPALIEPCIKAGCPKDGTVLDPFGGAGTTGLVADRLGRNAILVELNPEYAAMAERRLKDDAGMFAEAL